MAVFFSFPLIVWVFSISLKSESSFSMLSGLLQSSFLSKAITFLILVGFSYHLLAGFKKLISDAFGAGETLESGRVLSWLVIGTTCLMALFYLIYLF